MVSPQTKAVGFRFDFDTSGLRREIKYWSRVLNAAATVADFSRQLEEMKRIANMSMSAFKKQEEKQ